MSIYHSDSLPTISCHETYQTDKGLLGITECVCDKACQYITSLPLMYAHTCTHQSTPPSGCRGNRWTASPNHLCCHGRPTPPGQNQVIKNCNGLEWLCAIALHHVVKFTSQIGRLLLPLTPPTTPPTTPPQDFTYLSSTTLVYMHIHFSFQYSRSETGTGISHPTLRSAWCGGADV